MFHGLQDGMPRTLDGRTDESRDPLREGNVDGPNQMVLLLSQTRDTKYVQSFINMTAYKIAFNYGIDNMLQDSYVADLGWLIRLHSSAKFTSPIQYQCAISRI